MRSFTVFEMVQFFSSPNACDFSDDPKNNTIIKYIIEEYRICILNQNI
jgi:hypothetical protein